jgi:CheY-like chemotaxis protein
VDAQLTRALSRLGTLQASKGVAHGAGVEEAEEGVMPRKRVLIVEDEAESRTMIREMLEMSGYEPSEAADGTEGLAKAEDLRLHVILLDVRMRGLDGYEVCQGVKENPVTSSIPVIFLTAVEDVALNRLAFQAGAVACITKPFRREALVAVVEAALASMERQAKPRAESDGSGD